MAKFFYVARDKSGAKLSGCEEGANEEEVINRLQAKDLLVVKVVSEELAGLRPGLAEKIKFKTRHQGITSADLILFCRQLATLLGAGVAMLKCLEIISQQVSSVKLQRVIKELEKSMEQGMTFHEALAKHSGIFSELWINLVESGEASGNLAMVLERLADYLERMASFRGKIITSLMYPTLLIIGAVGALLFLTVKIIPTFAELFSGFNIPLPALTRILIAVSGFIRKYAIIIFGAAGLGFWVFKKYTRTKEGRRRWEDFKFHLPVFGEFFRALIVERFSSGLSTLLESGVPILYSLEISEQSVGNLVVGEIIRNVKEKVRQGRPLSQPLEESGFFEPMVVQMITIGEEIGELPSMLKRINAFYQEYLETTLNRFTALFEPITLIFIGGVIGIMVIGMFLPIFQITKISG